MESTTFIPIENLNSAVNNLYDIPVKYFGCYPKDLKQLKKIEGELSSVSLSMTQDQNSKIAQQILGITQRVAQCLVLQDFEKKY